MAPAPSALIAQLDVFQMLTKKPAWPALTTCLIHTKAERVLNVQITHTQPMPGHLACLTT